MKKIITILIFFISIKGFTQTPPGYIKLNTKVNYIGIKGDSAVIVPGDTLTSAPLNSIAIKGGKFWMKLSTYWTEVISGAGVDSVYKKGVTDSIFFRRGGIAFFAFRDSATAGGAGDGNNYPTSITFNTGTGVVNLGRSGLGDLTVDLDGKYVNISDTAAMMAARALMLDNANGIGDSLFRIISGVYQWKRITNTNRIKLTSADSTLNIDVIVRNFGSGAPDNTKYLRGDSTWSVPPSGVPDSSVFSTKARVKVMIDSAGAANAVTFDNSNLYDSLMRSPVTNTIQFKGIRVVAGANATVTPTITDSTISYSVASTGGAGSLTVAKDCPVYLDTVATFKMIDRELYSSRKYFAFPNLARVNSGRIFMGYYRAANHVDSGQAWLRYSDNNGQTWSTDTLIASSGAATSYSDPTVSQQGGDTLLLTYFFGSSVFFHTSVNNGSTWSARGEINTGDSILTEGNHMNWKGKWLVPVYGDGVGTASKNGVAYTSNSGATWAISWFAPGYSGSLQMNEMGMIATADSIIAFSRSDVVGLDTLYRNASFDGITWTIPRAVSGPFEWRAGKPAVLKMPDGRILLNYRSRENPYVFPDNGKVAISSDNGLSFTYIYNQIQEEYMYGSLEYIGDDYYMNVYSAEKVGDGTKATIYQNYYKVPSCETSINGTVVETIGNPLWRYFEDRRGGGGGSITLAAIGSTPNANGATLSGSALNLEPASASFGGVLTAGTQTIAGAKTFNNNVIVQPDAYDATTWNGNNGVPTKDALRDKIETLSGGSGWGLTGNSGTSPATNFIGTVDDQSLRFKINSVFSGLITRTAHNTFLGFESGLSITGGVDNTAIGYQSLYQLAGTSGNTAVGNGALATTTNGTGNTAVGSGALYSAAWSDENTAAGYQAAYSTGGGGNQTAFGAYSLQNSSGVQNLGFGRRTGMNLTTGNRNIIIGDAIDFPSASADGQLNIQNIIFGTGNNTTAGTIGTGSIGIGIKSPSVKFDVEGAIKSSIASGYAYNINGSLGTNSWTTKGREDSIHAAMGGGTTLAHGTFTPTFTPIQNIIGSTAYQCQYLRVGNTVTVSGRVDIDPDVTLTVTYLDMTLPIASAFTNANQAAGTIGSDGMNESGTISSQATNDRVTIALYPTSVISRNCYFTYTYQVL